MSVLEGLGPDEQLQVWRERAHDQRPSLGTGFPSIDSLLFRRGWQPGTFVILGGRTHTRKTAVALNIAANLLRSGVAVGLVGLDEAAPSYVAKLASVLTYESDYARGKDAEWLEVHWDEPEAEEARRLYKELAQNFTLSRGFRPTFDALTAFVEDADAVAARPQVVIIDYLALLARGQYDGSDTNRIPRLAENLRVWTQELEVVTLAIHQVGRQGDSSGRMNVGDLPVTLEQLKYGGEEMADVVLGTYRPALNHLGNLTWEEAVAQDDRLTEERYIQAVERVQRYKNSTFLQLLKNRPSQKGLLFRGVELVSPSSSMYMREAIAEDLSPHEDWEKQHARNSR